MIYRFRVGKKWYAYYTRFEAEIARNYFIELNFPDVGKIEEIQNNKEFQFGF